MAGSKKQDNEEDMNRDEEDGNEKRDELEYEDVEMKAQAEDQAIEIDKKLLM